MAQDPKALKELNKRLTVRQDDLAKVNQAIAERQEVLDNINRSLELALAEPGVIKLAYSKITDLPEPVQKLPAHAQEIYMAAFNSAWKEHPDDETTCAKIAWNAVGNSYEKKGDQWVKKAREIMVRSFVLIDLPTTTAVVGTTPPPAPTSTIQVLRTGTFYHPGYGKFTITPEDLLNMIANFGTVRPKPPTEMVVDFEHLSAAEPAQVSPAAGWVKALTRKSPDTLFATVEWTAEAADMIRNRQYRYISPEFTMDYTDKESGKKAGPTLIAVALTNRPFLEGMQPVILSKELQAGVCKEACAGCPNNDNALADGSKADNNGLPGNCPAHNKPDDSNSVEAKARAEAALRAADTEAKVDKKTKEKSMINEAELRAALGLKDEKDDILTAVKALFEKAGSATTLQAQLTEATLARDEANKAKDVAMQTVLAAEAKRVIAQAVTDGKLLPKQEEWATELYLKDAANFAKYLAATDTKGPQMGERGGDNHQDAAETLTTSEIEIGTKMAKQNGKPVDAYLKTLRENKARLAAKKQ
jgi:phage I-like protein/cation transport regulator ChaB